MGFFKKVRLKGAAVTAVALIGTGVATAAPAHAEGTTGCSWGDGSLCLYYNSNGYGSFIGAYGNVYNYDVIGIQHCIDFGPSASGCGPYKFTYGRTGNWAGEGQNIKNNTASAMGVNLHTDIKVFYNSGYAGPWDEVGCYADCQVVNLNHTYNQNASQYYMFS